MVSRMHHRNVQPGKVIGHQQHRSGDRWLPQNFKCDASMAQKRQRPGLNLRALVSSRQTRHVKSGNPHAI